MKKLLKMFSIVFVLALSVFAFSACTTSEDPKEPEGLVEPVLEFELINNGTEYEVSGLETFTDTNIVIPSTHDGKPVTAIGYSAFKDEPIISITIPSSITSISSSAFYGCSSLASITVESGNTVYDSRNNCNAIIETATNKLVQGCSITTIPNDVTSIGSRAFYGSGLTSITIPNNVIEISSSAFSDCASLTSITIPNSITEIRMYTFDGCSSLTSVTIPSSVESIGEQAFYGCSSLTNITIPSSVTRIKDYAFYSCTSLTSISIPSSVTLISGGAFSNCINLTNIVVDSANAVYDSRNNCNAIIETASNKLVQGCCTTIIPNDVTSIGSNAFNGCTSLTSITIPSSVTSIGSYAFVVCINLKTIIVETGNTVYDSRNNCNAIIETATNKLVQGCSTTIIPNDVTSIGFLAFAGSDITSITIPSSVISIGDYAFAESTLTSITIPSSVTTIGNHTFEYCDNLTSIVVENSTIANGLIYGSSYGYIATYSEKIYIKTGLDTSASEYLLDNFTKQATSDKTGYDMYVRNAE